MRRFAISDIHGCAKTFDALLDTLGLTVDDQLFVLGDLVDRGPNSRAVIDRVRQLRAAGYPVQTLMGNHEDMMLRSPFDLSWYRTWMINGGIETLDSFGADEPRDIEGAYFDWMKSLPLYLETPGYLLVHAGVDFSRENPLSHRDSLLWIRDWYGQIDTDWLGDRVIVHGHTPISRTTLEEGVANMHEQRVVNIDAGCVFNWGRGLGYLCALDLDERCVHFQEMID